MQSTPPRQATLWFWRPTLCERVNDVVKSSKSKFQRTLFGFIPLSQDKFIKVGRTSTQGILECEFQGQYLSKGEAAGVKKTKSSSSCNRWTKDGAGLKKAWGTRKDKAGLKAALNILNIKRIWEHNMPYLSFCVICCFVPEMEICLEILFSFFWILQVAIAHYLICPLKARERILSHSPYIVVANSLMTLLLDT